MKKYTDIKIRTEDNTTHKSFKVLNEYQFDALRLRVVRLSIERELFDDIFIEYTMEGTRYVWYPSGYQTRAAFRPISPGYDPELEEQLRLEASRLAWYY